MLSRRALVLLALVLVAGAVLITGIDRSGRTRADYCDPPEQVQAPADVEDDPTSFGAAFIPVAAVEGAIAMADVGDGRLLVAAKDGHLWTVPKAGGEPRLALDLSAEVATGYEQGLLGVAVHPSRPLVYLSVTLQDGTERLLEYALTSQGLDADTRRDVLVLDDPDPTHNGGTLAFDADGMLLFGIGDGGNGDATGAAQDLSSPFGKILRIDPTSQGTAAYGIPSDNPFVDVQGARGEVWAYGFRNPWGWSIDSATGDLWVGDVGHLCFEEISVSAGAGRAENFGWSHLEGGHEFLGPVLGPLGEPDEDKEPAELAPRPEDLVPPLIEYPHADDGCSVIGGYVYRGEALPDLQGVYLWADLCRRAIYTLRQSGDAWLGGELRGPVPAAIVAFAQDREGELYVLSLRDGLFRIADE